MIGHDGNLGPKRHHGLRHERMTEFRTRDRKGRDSRRVRVNDHTDIRSHRVRDAVELATETIRSGQATKKLDDLIALTQDLAS